MRLLSWLALATFIAFAFYFTSCGLAKFGQRIFLAIMFAWQIIAAYGLSTGVFSSRQYWTEALAQRRALNFSATDAERRVFPYVTVIQRVPLMLE